MHGFEYIPLKYGSYGTLESWRNGKGGKLHLITTPILPNANNSLSVHDCY